MPAANGKTRPGRLNVRGIRVGISPGTPYFFTTLCQSKANIANNTTAAAAGEELEAVEAGRSMTHRAEPGCKDQRTM